MDDSHWPTPAYMSISISLNILLTLMIVVRPILHGRNICVAMGFPAGISGLYTTTPTMPVESSALFAAAASLLVIISWTVDSTVTNGFLPILSKAQVCPFPQHRPLGKLPYVTTEQAGHFFTAHHSTSCQQERANEQHYRPWKYQPVQSWQSVGVDWW